MLKSIHILTLSAFLSSIIAPTCGFAWGGSYSIIEICTDKGIETRHISDEQSDKTPTHKTAKACQFCFASAHLTGFLPDKSSVKTARFTKEKVKHALYQIILHSQQASNGHPRAPPYFI